MIITRAKKRLRKAQLAEKAKKPVPMGESLNNPQTFLSQSINQFLDRREVAGTTALLNHAWSAASKKHPSIYINNRFPSYAAWKRWVEAQDKGWKKSVTHFTLHGIIPPNEWDIDDNREIQTFTKKHFALLVKHFPNIQHVDIEVNLDWEDSIFPKNVCKYLNQLPLTHLRLHSHHNCIVHASNLEAISMMEGLRFLSLGVSTMHNMVEGWEPAGEKDFELLSALPNLETLEIIATRNDRDNVLSGISTEPDTEDDREGLFKPEILIYLARIPKLRALVTDKIEMDDIALEHLQAFKLSRLVIRVKGLTPRGFQLLAALAQLTDLRLEQYYSEARDNNLLNDKDLVALQHLTTLRSLSVGVYLTDLFDFNQEHRDDVSEYREGYVQLNSQLPRGTFLPSLSALSQLQILKFTVKPVFLDASTRATIDGESVMTFVNTKKGAPLALCEVNGTLVDPRISANRNNFFKALSNQKEESNDPQPSSSNVDTALCASASETKFR